MMNTLFFFYKNIQNFSEPQLFHCLFLNFHCSLAILSLNILIKFILIKKKECTLEKQGTKPKRLVMPKVGGKWPTRKVAKYGYPITNK